MALSRQHLFRYYPILAVLGGAAAIAAAEYYQPQDRLSVLGAIVASVLGFCYFVQQQKLAETNLFKDLFVDFNARYDKLNAELGRIRRLSKSAGEPQPKLSDADRALIMDYFNLCAEEYLFYSEGYIHREVWRSWCAGMLSYFREEPFRSQWNDEDKASYYGLTLAVIESGAA